MGIVVTPEHILTCAHVINQVIGKQEVEVWVDFPFFPEIQAICYGIKFKDDKKDIAILEALESVTKEITPLRLYHHQTNLRQRNTFSVFGFPQNYQAGVWVYGEIQDKNTQGWIQMEVPRSSGYDIEPGFSGGPVWDEMLGGVIGMVVAADSNKAHRTGFCIPTTILSETVPELFVGQEKMVFPDTIVGNLESAKLLISEVQELFHEPSVWPFECKIAIDKIRAVWDVHIIRSYTLLDAEETLSDNQQALLNGLRVSMEPMKYDVGQLMSKMIAFEEITQDDSKETKRENQQILNMLDKLKSSILKVSE